MKITQLILDFVLSLARVFFPWGKRSKHYCPRCGCLVGTDGICRCCDPTDRSGTGSPGSHTDLEQQTPANDTRNSNHTEPSGSPGSDDAHITRLIGYAMIAVAVTKWALIE